MIFRLTGGIGVDRAIDAVGIDANIPHQGPGVVDAKEKQFKQELHYVAPETNPQEKNWHTGDAPSEALRWAVASLAKAGSLSVIGVYPNSLMVFPIGKSMNKNLTIKMGNCNHRRYIPELIELINSGSIDPSVVISQRVPFSSAIDAYKAFDSRETGWIRVA